MNLSPIEVELLRNALSSICDEMYLALMKSAYSTNIKERKDHSAAIFDASGQQDRTPGIGRLRYATFGRESVRRHKTDCRRFSFRNGERITVSQERKISDAKVILSGGVPTIGIWGEWNTAKIILNKGS